MGKRKMAMWRQLCNSRYLTVKIQSYKIITLSAALLLPSFAVSTGYGQENYTTWSDSAKIFINTTNTGANVSQNVTNFPVLVRLNPSVFDGFAKTLPGGADIRFAKSDGTHLRYEIERWKDGPNHTDTAELWVRVDVINGNSNTQYFRMYWGKSGVTSQSNPRAVFDSANAYRGAWHLTEDGGDASGNYKDATGLYNGTGTSMTSSSDVPGAIGVCQQFDGTADYISLGNVGIHNYPGYTVSLWVQGAVQKDKRLFGEADTTNTVPMFSLGTHKEGSNGNVSAYIRDGANITQVNHITTAAAALDASWHHVAWVDNQGVFTMYVDGVQSGTGGSYTKNTKPFTTSAIGAHPRKPATYFFAGAIDELNLSRTTRSAAWIKLSYETQKPAAMCVYMEAHTPPSISVDPRDTAVQVNQAATMSVTAKGSTPLYYQWYKDGITPNHVVPNQKDRVITFTATKLSDSGTYTCIVWNAYGRDTSTPGKLTVLGTKPQFTLHPKDTHVLANYPWSMRVSASGIPAPSYTWYKAGNPSPIGFDSIYSVQAALLSDTGHYSCLATNSFGTNASQAAKVTVQPNSQNVINPVIVRGTFKNDVAVTLTISGYAPLPLQPTPGFPWYADTVMIWRQTGLFPSGKPDPAIAARKLALSQMQAAGSTFAFDLSVPPHAGEHYYFKGSVHWRNNSAVPPDSIPHFSADANGTKVFMGDSTRLANPLVMRFGYKSPDSQVLVTIDSVKSAKLRWDLITGADLRYSIGGGAPSIIPLTKERLRQGGDTCMVAIRNSLFSGIEKTVTWQLLLTGLYKNSTDTAFGECKVGAPRPVNTLVARADSVWDNRVKLLWNTPNPAVNGIRIWYGRDTVPTDSVPSPAFSSVTVPGTETMAVISGMPCSTLVFFGLQVERFGVWSIIPDAAKTSARTLPEDPTKKPIANKVKLLDTVFDFSTNKLLITWKVDTSDVVLEAGIVWSPDSLEKFPEPSTLPKNGECVLIADPDPAKTVSLAIDIVKAYPPLEFGKNYFFGIFLQKFNEKWSQPTDSSTFWFRIPKPQAVQVTCFKDTNSISVFDSAVVLTKIVNLNVTTKIHFISPPPSLPGLVPVSDAFLFEPQGSVPDHSPIRFGMRHQPIPAGFTLGDIRMYHYDATVQQWFVDTVPDRDPVTSMISINTLVTHLKHLFILAIDIVRPAIDTSQADTSVVWYETDIPVQAAVTDNIANPEILLLAGRADSTYLYKTIVPLSAIGSCKVPASYVQGTSGMRIQLVANDGRLADTADFSRDMRIPDADITLPEYEKWKPLSASVTLDSVEVQKVLDEFAQPGMPWEYDKMTLRLFQWADGDWLEYSHQIQNRFTFIPGRVIWLKTRKTDRLINLGNGRTVSLKRPYTITMKKYGWTDFSLPYRFKIYIGDILSATDSLASKELQFYVWKRNPNGQFFTGELYLPQNTFYNDKKNVLTDVHDNERAAYSVWNPFPYDVELRIPGISVAVSQIPAERHKQTAGWTIAVRPRTKDNEELSPVFCAYRADGGSCAAYPLPPGWGSRVSVGIREPGRNGVYGNVIRSELVNGGCAYQLVFENNEATPATITCAIERPAGTGMTIGLLDPQSGTARYVDSLLTVSVGANSREYRWLAAGDPRYIDGLSQKLTRGEFDLSRIAPNPFRGTLRIDYTIPYGGIESTRCELIDQLGRVVWSAKSGRSVRPGPNTFTWNKHRKTLAAGAYIVRLTGFDGGGKRRAERMSRVMYLP